MCVVDWSLLHDPKQQARSSDLKSFMPGLFYLTNMCFQSAASDDAAFWFNKSLEDHNHPSTAPGPSPKPEPGVDYTIGITGWCLTGPIYLQQTDVSPGGPCAAYLDPLGERTADFAHAHVKEWAASLHMRFSELAMLSGQGRILPFLWTDNKGQLTAKLHFADSPTADPSGAPVALPLPTVPGLLGREWVELEVSLQQKPGGIPLLTWRVDGGPLTQIEVAAPGVDLSQKWCVPLWTGPEVKGVPVGCSGGIFLDHFIFSRRRAALLADPRGPSLRALAEPAMRATTMLGQYLLNGGRPGAAYMQLWSDPNIIRRSWADVPVVKMTAQQPQPLDPDSIGE